MTNRTPTDPAIADALATGALTTDPDTGHVHHRDGHRIVGRQNGLGYLQAKVSGRFVLLHRVVWIDANGPIPDRIEVNHINGDRADNRLANLELVTSKQNKAHARALRTIRTFDTTDLDPEWVAKVFAMAERGQGVTAAEVATLAPSA